MNLLCPLCQQPLLRVPLHHRLSHVCGKRHGRAFSTSALRKWLVREEVPALDAALKGARPASRACPRCRRAMQRLAFAGPELDHCPQCTLLWLDSGEFEQMPMRSEADIASAEVVAQVEPGLHFRPGLSPWENTSDRDRGFGAYTFLLIFAFCALSYIGRHSYLGLFVFDPQAPLRLLGVPALLSIFFHVDFLHFAGNGLFLIFIGNTLERTLGDRLYLQLFFFSAFGAKVASALFTSVPSVGASGAIAGLFIAFWATEPDAVYVKQVRQRIPGRLLDFVTITYRIPVAFWGAAWICTQVAGAFMQSHSGDRTNYVAHLGGALAGLIFVWISDLKTLMPSRRAASPSGTGERG